MPLESSERRDPPAAGTELATIMGFLQYERDTLLRKVDGLSVEQLRSAPTVSTLTLAGLLKHLALVEESWLIEDFLGQPLPEPWASVDWEIDPDWEHTSALVDDPEWLVARYRQAWETVDRSMAATPLDHLAVRSTRINGSAEAVSLRWILLHLIEETARHNGHADLIREALDGVTGE